MRIMSSVPANNAARMYHVHMNISQNNVERLSSGKRIRGAADDLAGLAISERARAYNRSVSSALKNVQKGTSLLQLAEGELTNIHHYLQRMRELAVQRANDTASTSEQLEIQQEMDSLKAEIGKIAENTEFNTIKLFNGSTEEKLISETTADMNVSNPVNLLIPNDGTAVEHNMDISGFSINLSFRQVGKKEVEITARNNSYIILKSTVSKNDLSKANTINFSPDVSLTRSSFSGGTKTEIELELSELNITFNGKSLKKVNDINIAGILTTREYDNVAVNKKNINLQIGPNNSEKMNIKINNSTPEALGLDNLWLSREGAISVIDNAIAGVSDNRVQVGSYLNVLGHRASYLQESHQNHIQAVSRITDADMAQEAVEMVQRDMLFQSAAAVMSQANISAKMALKLMTS